MNEQAKALSFDIITNQQLQLNAVTEQNSKLMEVVQSIGEIVGATEGTKIDDLPELIKHKLSETTA